MTRILGAFVDELAHLIHARAARRWCAKHGHRALHGAWPPICGTCHRLV